MVTMETNESTLEVGPTGKVRQHQEFYFVHEDCSEKDVYNMFVSYKIIFY